MATAKSLSGACPRHSRLRRAVRAGFCVKGSYGVLGLQPVFRGLAVERAGEPPRPFDDLSTNVEAKFGTAYGAGSAVTCNRVLSEMLPTISRAYYSASAPEFLLASPAAILGELVAHHTFAVMKNSATPGRRKLPIYRRSRKINATVSFCSSLRSPAWGSAQTSSLSRMDLFL